MSTKKLILDIVINETSSISKEKVARVNAVDKKNDGNHIIITYVLGIFNLFAKYNITSITYIVSMSRFRTLKVFLYISSFLVS